MGMLSRTRREFLKMASVAPMVAAVPATAVSAGAAGGVVDITVPLSSVAGASIAGASAVPMPLGIRLAHRKLREIEEGEGWRRAWYRQWRRARLAARRKGVDPEPAQVVWGEYRAKVTRKEQAAADAGMNPIGYPGYESPRVSRETRIRAARVHAAMVRAGFPKMPWAM